MAMVELKCPVCSTYFTRHSSRVVKDGVYCCSMSCKESLYHNKENDTYKCKICEQWLPSDQFRRYPDIRYKEGVRRQSYCHVCAINQAKKYHDNPKHKIKAKLRHDTWRKRCLEEGGDKALRWYFARQIGGYRRRSKQIGVVCDLTLNFLVSLFHEQEGCCYYSGALLDWNSYGKKTPTSESMSVDRLIPKKGYVIGNVVLCTYRLNTMKGNLSEKEFYKMCQCVLDRRK